MAACALLEVPCIWEPESRTTGVERFLMADPDRVDPAQEALINLFAHRGTHEAYVNLIKGEADFILVARSPSADELRAADGQGVQLDVRPVALDAFVFLANVGNPVDGINLEQARRIYTGEIANWSALGGPDRPIHAYQRDPNSGSQELMTALVMQGAPMIEAPDMILFTMIGPVNAIHDDVAGIGYSVYYYAAFIMPDEQVKLLAVEGVAPTSESIARRAYPLTTEVYAAVRQGTPASSPAVLLRDWLLTPDGQAAVAASGYVPVR
jgi:phosphate transport system substrate-binding protein